MNYPIHCATSRQNCATPYSCGPGGEACPMVSTNCSGRQVANGKAVEFMGKEAEEPPLQDAEMWQAGWENFRFWAPIWLGVSLVAGYFYFFT